MRSPGWLFTKHFFQVTYLALRFPCDHFDAFHNPPIDGLAFSLLEQKKAEKYMGTSLRCSPSLLEWVSSCSGWQQYFFLNNQEVNNTHPSINIKGLPKISRSGSIRSLNPGKRLLVGRLILAIAAIVAGMFERRCRGFANTKKAGLYPIDESARL